MLFLDAQGAVLKRERFEVPTEGVQSAAQAFARLADERAELRDAHWSTDWFEVSRRTLKSNT